MLATPNLCESFIYGFSHSDEVVFETFWFKGNITKTSWHTYFEEWLKRKKSSYHSWQQAKANVIPLILAGWDCAGFPVFVLDTIKWKRLWIVIFRNADISCECFLSVCSYSTSNYGRLGEESIPEGMHLVESEIYGVTFPMLNKHSSIRLQTGWSQFWLVCNLYSGSQFWTLPYKWGSLACGMSSKKLNLYSKVCVALLVS